jgi:hypothetical protein
LSNLADRRIASNQIQDSGRCPVIVAADSFHQLQEQIAVLLQGVNLALEDDSPSAVCVEVEFALCFRFTAWLAWYASDTLLESGCEIGLIWAQKRTLDLRRRHAEQALLAFFTSFGVLVSGFSDSWDSSEGGWVDLLVFRAVISRWLEKSPWGIRQVAAVGDRRSSPAG